MKKNFNIHHNDGQNPYVFKTFVVNGDADELPEDVLKFLPPELRQLIIRDITRGGNPQAPSKEENEEKVEKKKIYYDYKTVNCNQDLKTLVQKLKNSKTKQFGMLLYGVSGAGKSYFSEWLAQELKLGFVKKRASDLQAKFVGETEANIKNAFKEAKEKKAILVFDEADSFLYDRKYSQREFEASSVNEMLTQMEDHPYPFVMTTNLKDRIDTAAMRRFIFKIKFEYMTSDNIKAAIKNYFGKQFKLTKDQLEALKYITIGDFVIAKKKMDILDNGNYTSQLIYEYLFKEQEEKEIKTGSKSIKI